MIIDKKTLMPLGAVAGVVAAAIWLMNMRHAQETANLILQGKFESIQVKVDSLFALVEHSNNDHVSRGEWRSWCQLLKAQNGDLNVPETGN